jgi:tetratricopeptide (TPR) repeat protein
MRQGRAGAACLFAWAGIVMAHLFSPAVCSGNCEEWIAKVVSVQGDVEVRKSDEPQWHTAKLNDFLCSGDIIRVNEKSRAEIVLSNDSTLRLDQGSAVTFLKREKEKPLLMDFLKGAAQFFSRVPRSIDIITPWMNAMIRGTEFFVRVEDNRTLISVFEGEVVAENAAGSLAMGRGQSAVAVKGMAPELSIVVRPRDAVQWALYYPPVLLYRPSDFGEGLPPDWQAMVKRSLDFSMKGEIRAAFESIAGVPGDIRDPRFFTYRASLLLTVGRLDEARSDIDKALDLSPSYSNAIALQSVIAVVQNNKEKALELARKAVETDTHSASALIALSYAQQANFDLQGALNSLKDAVKLDPSNALAWARLSELQLSFAYYDKALEAAQKAVALDPDLSRTQTVLGYAFLAEVRIKDSKDAFERAIELDQADPLPRLGLGLARIREGDLNKGRKEIETAVALDPDNSLIRSYLGKAYYEEKRDKKASVQFKEAEEFDPKDPTPWFYDAIRKQSINRPVEALHDLQTAIELNDNRAVYRSKLLLDEDLAARSASLARIYTDLGFQQLALVEGWKSVNADPADFSGHRFLADTYSALPRHEIARVSELLQSQLLQPINITPVQPSLAEANLLILDGAGPSTPSFNEFNPLFNRNRIALQLNGVAGGDSTWGDEAIVSGVYNKLSFSAGQFHYETNGFRENNDQKQDIYNLFAQWSPSPQTSLQAEFRARDFKRGDLQLLFDPDNFSKDLRQDDSIRSMRFGLHHSFTSFSDFIGSVIYEKADLDFRIPDDHINIKEDGILAEAQHMYRTNYFNIISGIGYFNKNREENENYSGETSTSGGHPHQSNLYLYSDINYFKDVSLTIGGSADFFKGQIADKTLKRNQFNPKFGLTINPLNGTTIRAAIFRTLKRSLLTDQTIEPTEVAGFNQFFDDVEGTSVWNYGIGIDQRFLPQLYGGAEFFKRDLKVPGLKYGEQPPTEELIEADCEEKLARAYIYWAPQSWVALSTEYQFEHLIRPREAAFENTTRLNTHRLLFGIGFFHPSGISVILKPQYIYQGGDFAVAEPQPEGAPIVVFLPSNDNFWVFDASVSYRLPKRTGIITIGAKNLFDKGFKFQDIDPSNPTIYPRRLILARFTLAL